MRWILLFVLSALTACSQVREPPASSVSVVFSDQTPLVLRDNAAVDVALTSSAAGRLALSLVGPTQSKLVQSGLIEANTPLVVRVSLPADLVSPVTQLVARVVSASGDFGVATREVSQEKAQQQPCASPNWVSYAPQEWLVGAEVSALPVIDTASCGVPTSFLAETALPMGIVLNPLTGQLSGAVSSKVSQRDIQIVASNASYSSTVQVGIRADAVSLQLVPPQLKTTEIGSHDVAARTVAVVTDAESVTCDRGQGFGPCDAGPALIWASADAGVTHRVRAASGAATAIVEFTPRAYHQANNDSDPPRFAVHQCDEVVSANESFHALLNRFAVPASKSVPPVRPTITGPADQVAYRVVCLNAGVLVTPEPIVAAQPITDTSPIAAAAEEPFHDLDLRAPGLVLIGQAAARATLRNTLSTTGSTANMDVLRRYNGVLRLADGQSVPTTLDPRIVVANLVVEALNFTGPAFTLDAQQQGGFILSNCDLTSPNQTLSFAFGAVVVRSHDNYLRTWLMHHVSIRGRLVTNSFRSVANAVEVAQTTPIECRYCTLTGTGLLVFAHGPHRLLLSDTVVTGAGVSTFPLLVVDRGSVVLKRTTLSAVSGQLVAQVQSPQNPNYVLGVGPAWGGSNATLASSLLSIADSTLTTQGSVPVVSLNGGLSTVVSLTRSRLNGPSDIITTSNGAENFGVAETQNELVLESAQLRKSGGTSGYPIVVTNLGGSPNPANTTTITRATGDDSVACNAGGQFQSASEPVSVGAGTSVANATPLATPFAQCAP